MGSHRIEALPVERKCGNGFSPLSQNALLMHPLVPFDVDCKYEWTAGRGGLAVFVYESFYIYIFVNVHQKAALTV